MSERGMISTERTASYKFLEQVLRPDRDKALLIHFDHDVELLQDLTSSRERLEKALDELKIGQPDEQAAGDQGGGGYPGGNPGGGGGWPRWRLPARRRLKTVARRHRSLRWTLLGSQRDLEQADRTQGRDPAYGR
jgi:hypothetical protein